MKIKKFEKLLPAANMPMSMMTIMNNPRNNNDHEYLKNHFIKGGVISLKDVSMPINVIIAKIHETIAKTKNNRESRPNEKDKINPSIT
ncbi:MAG: hypothetical protein NT094_05285 [Candidatus Staskawiczbacteria bacterium]|nr:hypothetical protein [Candidatus Staskawiczbacteria bacterium]